ncbi:cysteine desulfurase [Metabacillus crassostreae]|uniref:cysteine desulfurase family protein n=1 Tax=Metabacillus crassostreae TaxID=929098 RepID=UPI00195DAF3F|nr:cysteine desulfurase family protein [Metabacillus crassostreae]MBM7605617.1 cysteine desulfurase [Metabacillus crassostreae]
MLYLDNSATTKPYEDVLATFIKVTEEYFANPSSIHKLGSEAEGLLNQSRKQVANLLGVLPNEIIFTSGGTEGNNLAIKGAAFANQHKGKHLITSVIEHPSVLESFKQLEKIHGFEVTYLAVDESGTVSCNDLKKNLRNDTILVSIMHVNNEVGTIQPIAEMGQLIKQFKNTLFHVDHVQGVTKVPLNINDAHIDLCTISGHKFHGLNGTGALFIKTGVQLLPLFTGGSQELEMRSGTESLAGNVALAKALRLTTEKAEKQLKIVKETQDKLRSELMDISGVVINTPVFAAPHILNFSVPNLKAEVLIHYFGEHGIYLSTTSACSSRRKTISHTLLEMKKKEEVAKSAIRVSLSLDHNEEIVGPFITTLKNGISKLTKVMR